MINVSRMDSTACSRSWCINVANHYPVIRAWPKGHVKTRLSPERMVMELPLCPDHQVDVVPRELFTDESWRSICVFFYSARKPQPDRETLEVGFERIYLWRDHLAECKSSKGGLNG